MFPGQSGSGFLVGGGALVATTLRLTTDGTVSAPPININGRGGIFGTATGITTAAPIGTNGLTMTSGLASQNGAIGSTTVYAVGPLRTVAVTAFAAVTTVLAYAGTYQPVTLTAGAVVNGATPSISGGNAGEILILRGVTGAGTYAIQDKGTLASSGLTLMTTSVVIGLDDVVALLCTGAGTWVQIAPVANNI